MVLPQRSFFPSTCNFFMSRAEAMLPIVFPGVSLTLKGYEIAKEAYKDRKKRKLIKLGWQPPIGHLQRQTDCWPSYQSPNYYEQSPPNCLLFPCDNPAICCLRRVPVNRSWFNPKSNWPKIQSWRTIQPRRLSMFFGHIINDSQVCGANRSFWEIFSFTLTRELLPDCPRPAHPSRVATCSRAITINRSRWNSMCKCNRSFGSIRRYTRSLRGDFSDDEDCFSFMLPLPPSSTASAR